MSATVASDLIMAIVALLHRMFSSNYEGHSGPISEKSHWMINLKLHFNQWNEWFIDYFYTNYFQDWFEMSKEHSSQLNLGGLATCTIPRRSTSRSPSRPKIIRPRKRQEVQADPILHDIDEWEYRMKCILYIIITGSTCQPQLLLTHSKDMLMRSKMNTSPGLFTMVRAWEGGGMNYQ